MLRFAKPAMILIAAAALMIPAFGRARITSDARVIHSPMTISAGEKVIGDIVAVNTHVQVDGELDGSLVAIRSHVNLGKGAKITGNVTLINSALARVDGSSVVAGKVNDVVLPGFLASTVTRVVEFSSENHEPGPLSPIASALFALIVIVLTMAIAPNATTTIRVAIASRPVHAFFIGLGTILGLIAACVANAVLCVTIVWIPIALLIFIAAAVLLPALGFGAWAAGMVASYEYFGALILRIFGNSSPKRIQGVFATLGALTLLELLPPTSGIAELIGSALFLLGLGGVVKTGYGKSPTWLADRWNQRRSTAQPRK